jgi:D-beta-D-heptose 7-phosphate kinase/D-beta-D-heptose 1-phosphate adenosyltransferase
MLRILVIGEICEDIFIYGECKRLSPEAPIPVLNPIEVIRNDGMAGNVVRNLRAIGPDCYVDHWHQSQKITKTRFVDKKSNHMFLRVDEGENNVSLIDSSDNKIHEISNFDIVIVSDYNKGFLNHDWLKIIGKSSKLSIIDSKNKLTKEVVDSFTFVKLNEKEFQNNFDLGFCKNIIVTLGEKGAKFKYEVFQSPNPKETIDVSGAGDTFTASFILKYYQTKNIAESIIFANEMSSIVVSKRGVVTP